jgi:hypothetical protein
MTDHYYEILAADVRALVAMLDSFTHSEREEVLHFVDVGEYGLALETAFGIAVEESKPLTPEAKQRIAKLAALMGIEHELDISKLT